MQLSEAVNVCRRFYHGFISNLSPTRQVKLRWFRSKNKYRCNGSVSCTYVINMPLWGLQVLLIAGFLIQQSALPIYAQTNFALYQEAIVSSNDTCGLQENDEFCSAVDRFQRCQELDYCSIQCPFGENIPDSVDLVATGIFHGEVTRAILKEFFFFILGKWFVLVLYSVLHLAVRMQLKQSFDNYCWTEAHCIVDWARWNANKAFVSKINNVFKLETCLIFTQWLGFRNWLT